MALIHLSQDELIEFLDATQKNQDENTKKHVDQCSLCKKNLAEYQLIYDEIKHIQNFDPSSDFSALIMKNLPETIPQHSSILKTISMLSFFLSILSLSIIFIYQLKDTVSTFFNTIFHFVGSYQFVSENLNTLITMVILLLGFGILNRMFLEKKLI